MFWNNKIYYSFFDFIIKNIKFQIMANKNENQQDEVNANDLNSKESNVNCLKNSNESENHGNNGKK